MAKAADPFRSSDITIWGVVAIACWALAVLSANLSALVPASTFAALHSSRLDGGTVNQVRGEVASLGDGADQLRAENKELKARLATSEEAAGELVKRVSALEVSMPKVVEAQAARAATTVDPTETGSIDATETGGIGPGGVVTFEADGGSVSVVQRPLVPGSDEMASATAQPLPAAPVESRLGVAIGFPVAADGAGTAWHDLVAGAGPLLAGLAPLTTSAPGAGKQQLVAGPMADRTDATELCTRLNRIGIPCEVTDYEGEKLAN